MSSRFSSIGVCFVALATLLALSVTPASAQNSYRGEGRTAQASGAEGGHSYRRSDRGNDRRGGYRGKAPAGFESGRSYRRDDRSYRQRNHGYRHHKRRHENRMTVERKFWSESGHARPRYDRKDYRYRHDHRRDTRRKSGRFDRSYSGNPPVIIQINPWLAD